jgi:membrane-associated protease RseP (regulator of RpoE activity)
MIALEAAIEQRLAELIPEVSAHAGVTALLTGFQTLSKDQRQALETRLYTIADAVPISNETTVVVPADGLSQEKDCPVSTALQIVYTMFNQAVIGYSVLHPLATRFLDSPYFADKGTSYHLTRQHTQNYVQAIQQISRLLHDVVLWELDREGFECLCICPSCGVGICLCAMAGRSFLSHTWVEAGPIADDEGVYVQPPKQNSAAAKAGLRSGDIILAAGGQEFESWGDLFDAVENAEPGAEIRLTVRRDSDVLEEVAIVRPQT